MAGLRWARNALGHQQVIATLTTGGLTVPMTVPTIIKPVEITWRDADEISDKSDANRPHYVSDVQGKPLTAPLEAAERWVRSCLANAASSIP